MLGTHILTDSGGLPASPPAFLNLPFHLPTVLFIDGLQRTGSGFTLTGPSKFAGHPSNADALELLVDGRPFDRLFCELLGVNAGRIRLTIERLDADE